MVQTHTKHEHLTKNSKINESNYMKKPTLLASGHLESGLDVTNELLKKKRLKYETIIHIMWETAVITRALPEKKLSYLFNLRFILNCAGKAFLFFHEGSAADSRSTPAKGA